MPQNGWGTRSKKHHAFVDALIALGDQQKDTIAKKIGVSPRII